MNEIILNKKQLSILAKSSIFNNIDKQTLLKILSDDNCYMAEYSKGDIIFEPYKYDKALGYIVSGSVNIYLKNNDKDIFPMREIEKENFFGVASLFSENDEYISLIQAKSNSTILFFNEELVKHCIQQYDNFALNYIKFLVNRIEYLNNKISLLSNTKSANSVIAYLINQSNQFGKEFDIKTSYSKLAKSLNMGRSSLYRCLEELENSNIIKRQGRRINILNYERLKVKGGIDL